jgi:hypothetical protein
VRFPPQTFEDLRSKTLVDLRDKAEPFRFSVGEIQKIRALTKLKSFSLLKKNEIWKLEKEDPQSVVSHDLAENMIRQVGMMTVFRFQEKPMKKVTLANRLEFLGEGDKLIFSLAWGEFQDHGAPAETSVFGEPFLIDDAQVNYLQLGEIVKPTPGKVENKK